MLFPEEEVSTQPQTGQSTDGLPKPQGPRHPETQGPPTAHGPEPTAEHGRSARSGGSGAFSEVPSWPSDDDPPVPPAAEAQNKDTLKPPYAAPQVASGETTKSEYSTMSAAGAIQKAAAQAIGDTCSKIAAGLYPDDPTTAALAVATALQGVIAGTAFTAPGSSSSTPFSQKESKFTQEAILAGIMGERSGTGSDPKTNYLYKNAKLVPPFPGSACRTQPDLYEDWWEQIFALQTTQV